MEWTVSFLPEQQIVVLTTRGVADETDSREMLQTIPQIMGQYRAVRLLIDHSALSSVSGNTIDIYYRSKEINGSGIPAQVKVAEVVLPEHLEHFRFLETVCRNRGFDFRVFNHSEPALEWLTS